MNARTALFQFGSPGTRTQGPVPARTLEITPPPGWVIRESRADGAAWQHPGRHLVVIASIAQETDNQWWLHVSLSHQKRMPNYEEIAYVKQHFVGDAQYGIFVLPPKQYHVNQHPYCLHLWCCLDRYPLPEFSRGGGSI